MDKDKQALFDRAMYMVHVTGWPEGEPQPEKQEHPRGASGATFSGTMEPLPEGA